MGEIGFNHIPAQWRYPLVMAEFDSSRAMQGAAIMPYRLLLIGPRSGGSAPALLPRRVTQPSEAGELFGEGSVLAEMVRTALKNGTVNECWATGPEEDTLATAATATLTFSGAAASPGYVMLSIGGERVRIRAARGDDAQALARALVEAVNAAGVPVRASSGAPGDAGTEAAVVFTARTAGEIGNGLDIRLAAPLPEGVDVPDAVSLPGSPTPAWRMAAAVASVACYYGSIDPARPFNTLPVHGVEAPAKDGVGVRLSGGSGNPDLAPVLAALGDEPWQVMATAFTDRDNLSRLKEELMSRWGPLRSIEGVAFAAVAGTHGQLCDFGNAHNSPHLCLVHTGGPYTNEENNLLLWNGISALTPDDDGVVRIRKLVTTYKKTANGAADESYLSIHTILTLGYLRWDWRNRMARKYPRHKLGRDDARGANIMTPKKGRIECLSWFDDMAELGLVEDREAFKTQMKVERDDRNVNRLNFLLPPDLVNGFEIAAGVIEFRL